MSELKHNHWQNAKKEINNMYDERTWPILPRYEIKLRVNRKLSEFATSSRIHHHLPDNRCSEETDSRENFNEIEYPKLGSSKRIVPKKVDNFGESNRLVISDDCPRSEDQRSRIPRSTDAINVNLRGILVGQKWPVSPRVNVLQMSHYRLKNVTPRKTKTSVVQRSLEKRQLTVPKPIPMKMKSKRKLSKLKRVILDRYDRNCLAIQKEIRFERDTNDDITNDNESNRMGHELKLQNYVNNDPNAREQIDDRVIDAVESLSIRDEIGKRNDDICIVNEPKRFNFTKKFREYCTNTVTSELKIYLNDFLAEISKLQKKMYERDSVKGKCKRRYYAGIKEIQKRIELKKIKFVIVATDLVKVENEGGLDDAINKLLEICKTHEVPYCFGLERRKLGYYTHGNGFISCIGIVNYSGAEEKLKNVLLEVVEARNKLSRLMSDDADIIDVEKFLPKEELLVSEIIKAYLRILASTG